MNELMQQRLGKARAYAEHARSEVHEALFLLAALQPLTRDEKIVTPLNNTYAANTLELLQWTLFKSATINLCSGVLDRYDDSGSIKALMKLLDESSLAAAIRAERCEPIQGGARPSIVPVDVWETMKAEREKKERAAAEEEFDMEMPKLRAAVSALCDGELATRLWDLRRKVLAHGNMKFVDGKYRRSLPEDFGVLWDDAEKFAMQAVAIVEKVFTVLYGHHLKMDESTKTLDEYSEDFWRHLRAGLEAAGKKADGTVKERPR